MMRRSRTKIWLESLLSAVFAATNSVQLVVIANVIYVIQKMRREGAFFVRDAILSIFHLKQNFKEMRGKHMCIKPKKSNI